MEFKIGDTVALKSGGAAMTVIGHDSVGQVLCAWLDERCDYNCQPLPADAITPVIRKAIRIDEATIRYIWVFTETNEPIADHISLRAPAGEAPACCPTCGQDVL
jgi:uncharacterized protein YodC (DUF2158 family)